MMTPDDHALVRSAALWRAHGDAHLAPEIAQGTFILLALKAGDISAKIVLPGWLYRTTQCVAAAARHFCTRRRTLTCLRQAGRAGDPV